MIEKEKCAKCGKVLDVLMKYDYDKGEDELLWFRDQEKNESIPLCPDHWEERMAKEWTPLQVLELVEGRVDNMGDTKLDIALAYLSLYIKSKEGL